MVPEEKRDRWWSCYCGIFSWRRYLSTYGAASSSTGRVWVDHEDLRVSDSLPLGHGKLGYYVEHGSCSTTFQHPGLRSANERG